MIFFLVYNPESVKFVPLAPPVGYADTPLPERGFFASLFEEQHASGMLLGTPKT